MIQSVDPYQLLGQIARSRSDIKLLNIYKGLPISNEASINSIDNSEIQVHSNRYQIACLYHQRETYLEGKELPFILRSQVESLHLGKEIAILSNFELAPDNIGHRMQIRVEPDEPLIAMLRFDGSSSALFAPLRDISAEGAGVYIENYMFPARLCQPGNELSMILPLPDTISQKIKKLPTKPLVEHRNTKSLLHSDIPRDQDGKVIITTRGKVISVRPQFHLKRYRVGMRLFFKDLSRTVILQYISLRQSEIIRDLGILTDELYSRKK